MNSITIIGNLTVNPEAKSIEGAKGQMKVCNFTVAVNRTARGRKVTDYFRVACWGNLADNCMKYLLKGRKVAVVGTAGASAYVGNDGTPRARLEVMAERVEFLSSRQDDYQETPSQYDDYDAADDDHLPF